MNDNIKNLIIKLKLTGEVKGDVIPYKYTINTSQSSNKELNQIFLPLTTLLNKKQLAKSEYNKDYVKLFQSKVALTEFIDKLKMSKYAEKSKDEKLKPREIRDKNINTIKEAYFPIYSQIYLGKMKFTIKSVIFESDNIETVKSILFTNEQLEDDLLEKLEKKEIDNLTNQKNRFQKQYDKMTDQEEKRKFKNTTPLLDFTSVQIEDRARSKALKLLYGTGIDTSNLIKNHANKKLLEINEDRNKYFGLKYKFDESKGIILDGKKDIVVANFTMEVKKFEEKDKTMQKFTFFQNKNCKTRKQNIIDTYNVLFKGKKKSKKNRQIYKYKNYKIYIYEDSEEKNETPKETPKETVTE